MAVSAASKDRLVCLNFPPAQQRGKAAIHISRSWACSDVTNMQTTLTKCGFNIWPCNDIALDTKASILEALEKATADVDNYRNLIVFISAYHFAKDNDIIYAPDHGLISWTNDIQPMFTHKRQSLVGKCKFFFIQTSDPDPSSTQADSFSDIPVEANIMLYWSHDRGQDGECSPSVAAFCREVNQLKKATPLRDLLSGEYGRFESRAICSFDICPL